MLWNQQVGGFVTVCGNRIGVGWHKARWVGGGSAPRLESGNQGERDLGQQLPFHHAHAPAPDRGGTAQALNADLVCPCAGPACTRKIDSMKRNSSHQGSICDNLSKITAPHRADRDGGIQYCCGNAGKTEMSGRYASRAALISGHMLGQ